MMLKVYVDDSADQRQEKIAVAGAFVGNSRQWSAPAQRTRADVATELTAFSDSVDSFELSDPLPNQKSALRKLLFPLQLLNFRNR